MAESSTITREMTPDDVLARLASLRCHQTCKAAREQDGGKTPCLDCPDPKYRLYKGAKRDLRAALATGGVCG
jgi:hypothetical protein